VREVIPTFFSDFELNCHLLFSAAIHHELASPMGCLATARALTSADEAENNISVVLVTQTFIRSGFCAQRFKCNVIIIDLYDVTVSQVRDRRFLCTLWCTVGSASDQLVRPSLEGRHIRRQNVPGFIDALDVIPLRRQRFLKRIIV